MYHEIKLVHIIGVIRSNRQREGSHSLTSDFFYVSKSTSYDAFKIKLTTSFKVVLFDFFILLAY